MPGNVAALRNLAIIARDQGDLDKALIWTRQGLAAAQGSPEELRTMHQRRRTLPTPGRHARADCRVGGDTPIDPNDAGTLQTLSTLYSAR